MSKIVKYLNKYILEIDFEPRWIYINNVRTRYKITSEGEVLRYNKSKTKVKKLKHAIDKDGYHKVTLYINGKPYTKFVHRLVAMAYIPNVDNKPQVNHKNGDHDDNTVWNLEWATCKENIRHAFMTGLSVAKKGEKHPNSKYNDKQIHSVCKMLEENKLSMKEISILSNVSYTVVKQIRNHIIWNHISSSYNIDSYNIDTRSKKRR